MSEIFLVPLIHPDAAPRVLEAARRMADCVDAARIDVLAVSIPPETMIIPSDEAISTAHLDALIEQEAARIAKLKTAFDRWSGALPASTVSTAWMQFEGLPTELLPTHAQGADLVIIERPRRPIDQAQRQTTDAAIFGSHRPVLVVPPGASDEPLPAFGRRIAIAWKEDGRAVKAVIPALRYFERAERIAVIAGYRETAPPEGLPEPLAERGLAAEMHPLPIGRDPFGQSLLDKANAIGADLLVMGAYTHSPLRELFLGGVTRHVLAHAEIPILMRH